VGILGTALLRLYSTAIIPIFIEIGSYATDVEQKKSSHLALFFSETRCINVNIFHVALRDKLIMLRLGRPDSCL